MTAPPRKTRSRTDADGVKVVEVAGVRRGVWLLALAVVIAGAAGVIALRLALRSEAPGVTAAAAAPQVAAAPSAPPPVVPRRAHPVKRSAAPPPAAGEVPPTEAPLPEFPDQPVEGPSGIGLYPPPGTDPPKRGILVPEDFELPEGYVRHYQATDDGEGLPAILMFHPDYEWLDENGERIPLPADRVVPPELAPPGLPIQMLDVPPSRGESDTAP